MRRRCACALAALAGLRELPRLSSRVRPHAAEARGVAGRRQVTAAVGQTCVVTLEPIETRRGERRSICVHAACRRPTAEPANARSRSRKGEEPPEPLVDGTVDLGAIATEFLMLGIDPYPRKPGVEFDAAARPRTPATAVRGAGGARKSRSAAEIVTMRARKA